jgi:hypothetical protein
MQSGVHKAGLSSPRKSLAVNLYVHYVSAFRVVDGCAPPGPCKLEDSEKQCWSDIGSSL